MEEEESHLKGHRLGALEVVAACLVVGVVAEAVLLLLPSQVVVGVEEVSLQLVELDLYPNYYDELAYSLEVVEVVLVEVGQEGFQSTVEGLS